ncbi:MAG: BrnT family toxin, partial [Smithella sp.]
YNIYTMEFEFDSQKSENNKNKHGIDFRTAQALWDDSDYTLIPAKVVDEPRFLIIGKIKDKHWSGIITYRGERIRIISVRRSRKEEIDIYEG